jgi:hypothetical protein
MTDHITAANYQSLDLGTMPRQSAEIYWAHWCENPFGMGMAQWDIGKGDSREVGTRHYFNKALGISVTPGSGAINGQSDILNLRYQRDSFTRCQQLTATMKVDNAEYNRIMAEGFDIKRDANEGIRRYIDQQVIPFQTAKLIASADKCNVIGSASKPILINTEYTTNVPPSTTGAIRPTYAATRLLQKLKDNYGLCKTNDYKLMANSNFGMAMSNEGGVLNTHVECKANGESQTICEMKGHGIQLAETNWMPRIGKTAAGLDVYALAMYDPRRVTAPQDLLELEWFSHEGYKNLYLRDTFGFGVQDPKAIAVAYVAFVN